jgi:hypothetical protein
MDLANPVWLNDTSLLLSSGTTGELYVMNLSQRFIFVSSLDTAFTHSQALTDDCFGGVAADSVRPFTRRRELCFILRMCFCLLVSFCCFLVCFQTAMLRCCFRFGHLLDHSAITRPFIYWIKVITVLFWLVIHFLNFIFHLLHPILILLRFILHLDWTIQFCCDMNRTIKILRMRRIRNSILKIPV